MCTETLPNSNFLHTRLCTHINKGKEKTEREMQAEVCFDRNEFLLISFARAKLISSSFSLQNFNNKRSLYKAAMAAFA